METFIFNYAGGVYAIQDKGREYLVAPLTMIVPGVLNGSKGALFYPKHEVIRSAPTWEGVPITLRHPELDGQMRSAKEPGVLNRFGIGVVRKPKVTPEGILRAEGWFDVEKLERIYPGILEDLEAGRPIEVSTGLVTDNYAEPGTYHGQSYDYVARNYKPDHLALLPDQIGACSRQDGCGVLMNRKPTMPKYDDDVSFDSEDMLEPTSLGYGQQGMLLNSDAGEDDLLPPSLHSLLVNDARERAKSCSCQHGTQQAEADDEELLIAPALNFSRR